MFFLLRMAFWLTVVLALLPTGSSQPSAKAGSQVDAGDAVVAAGAAVSDLSNFCDRQAEACVVGAQTALAIGERAQAGAKMVFEFISERMAKSSTGSLPEGKSADAKTGAKTGTKGQATKTVAVPLPQPRPTPGTLNATDLAPAWRSPAQRHEAQPHKDRRPAA
jgi:hypothetical protein